MAIYSNDDWGLSVFRLDRSRNRCLTSRVFASMNRGTACKVIASCCYPKTISYRSYVGSCGQLLSQSLLFHVSHAQHKADVSLSMIPLLSAICNHNHAAQMSRDRIWYCASNGHKKSQHAMAGFLFTLCVCGYAVRISKTLSTFILDSCTIRNSLFKRFATIS